MKKIILVILSLLIWGGCAGTSVNKSGTEYNDAKYNLHYNLGLTRLANNESSYAMEEFLEAEKCKKTPDLYFSMGQACYMLKRYDLALTYFDKSLSLDRKYSNSNVGKGIVLREQGRYEEAIAQFNTALDNILFHEPERAYYNIALTYLEMNDLENAIKYFRTTVEIKPEFVSSYVQLAIIYLDLKNYESAVSALKTLIKYAPNSPEAHLLLGKTYLKLARSALAEYEFNEVIRLAPQSEYAREAAIYLSGGKN